MVANYTATGRPRRADDYTPGGRNTKRPNRATLVYANQIRRYFKNTVPIMLGGIEASLRRVAHYDFWTDKIRRSVLFDAKADYLLYGMAEGSVLEFAKALEEGSDPTTIRGLCYNGTEIPEGYLELPSYELVSKDKDAFTEMFHVFYRNNDPLNAHGLAQPHGNRYLIQNPPYPHLTQEELDHVYGLDYERDQHPYYAKQGKVKALETIRYSIPTHRGCYGECNFCAIAVHEGRTVQWRSEAPSSTKPGQSPTCPTSPASSPTSPPQPPTCMGTNARSNCVRDPVSINPASTPRFVQFSPWITASRPT